MGVEVIGVDEDACLQKPRRLYSIEMHGIFVCPRFLSRFCALLLIFYIMGWDQH